MSYKRPRSAFEADLQSAQSPYVIYGTPLPPVDAEVRDDGSYVPVWKQEVTDERGRKRLHGAFTGGFSAGYFNTVGSKEGWTPSTFVSSRTNRKKDDKNVAQQRPEDFMDDEDLAEAAEAQKLQVNDDFAGLGSTEQDRRRKGFIMDLLRPQGATMGTKLLQKMGWREGQGVGARIRRKADLGDHGASENGAVHTFAPSNTAMISFTRKDDRKGLGFHGEDRLEDGRGKQASPDNSDEEPRTLKPKVKIKPKMGAFGVGVLDDDDPDDNDPYEMGPKIKYNRVIGGDKVKVKAKSKASSLPSSNPLIRSKPVFLSKKKVLGAKPGFRKCHDGRFPLDGFLLSASLEDMSTTVSNTDNYPMPEIPEGWTSAKATSEGTQSAPFKSTADLAKASTLDPKSRAALLGESLLPGRSVFDFISPAARDRLAAASGKANLPAGRGEVPAMDRQTSQFPAPQSTIPELDPEVALQALGRGIGGWTPYVEDEAKRARYRAFLEYRGGLKSDVLNPQPGMDKDQWYQELQEFARAAQVFKPMTGMMASRFTSSSAAPMSQQDDSSKDLAALLSKPTTSQRAEDPAEKAAQMGMFGPLTRSTVPFYPSRLLCKRFIVRPPDHAGEDHGTEASARSETKAARTSANAVPELVQKSAMEQMLRESAALRSQEVSQATESGTTPQDGPAKDTSAEGPVSVDASRNAALEGQRAGEAVFKAVFGSDDDSD
ncbi:hypothetical protein MRB53_040389 [Persea americana]|nr:hypothetical protein MRB53_040389 [Persea americana]